MLCAVDDVQLPNECLFPRLVALPNSVHLCNELLEKVAGHLVGSLVWQNCQVEVMPVLLLSCLLELGKDDELFCYFCYELTLGVCQTLPKWQMGQSSRGICLI